MKELDFDELDKAVNSLMSGVPKSAPIKDDSVKTLTIDSTLPSGEPVLPDSTANSPAFLPAAPTPASEPAAPAQSSVPATLADTSSSLANRRGGRFMDVVHPSSDMTKATAAPRVSRQGVTIDPGVARPAVSDAPATPELSASLTPMPIVDAPAEATDTNEWPDPLDIHDSATPEPVAINEPTVPVPDAEKEDDTSAPLNSPFLTDTKVEKRPLGGAAPVEEPGHSPVLGVMAASSTTNDDLSDQLPPKPPEGDVALPEELQGDLMAIESDSHPMHQDSEVAQTPKPAEPSTDTATSRPSVPAASAVTTVTPQVQTGPSSITQQYKEEPNSGDQTSGAIFDTASYHQPLSHPAKKKSGWIWVVAVVLILLLGAGGGAALYFLGIV